MIGYCQADLDLNHYESLPKDSGKNPEVLWALYCNRLEAIGTIGVVRCFKHNRDFDQIGTMSTPQANEEVWGLLTAHKKMSHKVADPFIGIPSNEESIGSRKQLNIQTIKIYQKMRLTP